MKYYCYSDPSPPGSLYDGTIVTISEKEILDNYWNYWKSKMDEKFGEGYYETIPEKCIEDWVIINWAWDSPWNTEGRNKQE